MNYTISFHPEAETEYESAYNWYAQQQDGLGERFFEAVTRKLHQIALALNHIQ